MIRKQTRIMLLFLAALGLGLSMSILLRHGSSARLHLREEKTAEFGRQRVRTDVLSGRTSLKGEGVRIIIDDKILRVKNGSDIDRLLVHERHLLFLVNELFAAGAEGIAINGERMVAISNIRCVGPAVRINDTNKAPPFEVLAIGDKDVLMGAVMMMGGVVDSLSRHGMKVDVTREDEIEIGPYQGKFEVEYARSK